MNMKQFDPARLTWLLRNEMLTAWSRLLRYTIGGLIIGLLIYIAGLLAAMSSGNAGQYAMYSDVFPLVLMIGGVFFTASIFSNLHTPLENIQYLMTPVSAPERFLTKYLVSGPLFVVYLLLVLLVFEILAQLLGRLMFGTAGQFLDISNPQITSSIAGYLKFHVLVFAGAVFFRRHTLLKTMATYALLLGTGVSLAVLTLRLRFAGLFEGGEFALDAETQANLNMPQVWYFDFLWLLVCLWILYLAYLWLVDYEV